MSNATHSIDVNVPLDRAYAVWRDFENWPKFMPLLKQVTDTAAIEMVIDDIIAKNPDKVADARSNPKAIGWFVGQVMKSSGGKASPQVVNDILKRKLGL